MKIINRSTTEEEKLKNQLFELSRNCPIPDAEFLSNLGLFITRQNLSRMLFLEKLYRQIINIHGVIMEFGVRWGQNLAILSVFRSIYEPYNHSRKIIGFDTFEGFTGIDKKDGKSAIAVVGAYSVTKGYEQYLEEIMELHEKNSPLSHLKKYEIVKGDAVKTVRKYLSDNPETIIALAYFDFDIYKPTKKCLEAIKPHITKGTVLAFDELNYHDHPGETIALKETFSLQEIKLERYPMSPTTSFFRVE